MTPRTYPFRLLGNIADLDGTTPDDPLHPSLVIVIEFGEDLVSSFGT